jgi:hypothetical protein
LTTGFVPNNLRCSALMLGVGSIIRTDSGNAPARAMHLKSLKVFCDVVGRRSFSRAASENGISQSGASQIVNALEEHLGVKLIDRTKRPFVLTP